MGNRTSVFGLIVLTSALILSLLLGLLMTMALSLPVSKSAEPDQRTAQADVVVSGVVASVDPANQMIIMKTRFGRAQAFTVVRPDLLKDVSEGDTITVELDQQGVARKVTKTAAGSPVAPGP
jgi:arginine repressor